MLNSSPPSRGSCAGYDIRSSLPFSSLRPGGGTPLLVEERPNLEGNGRTLITWNPRPDNPFHGRLLEAENGFAFWASDAGWYFVDPDARHITVSPGADVLRRELRLFGVPTALCTWAIGDVSIHAAAVEVEGRGILLAGPSRYGKTTLAAAFARAGHRLLSEDTTRCSPRGPVIYPGPAVLRLRADVGKELNIPNSRLAPSDDEGRVPLIFDSLARGDGAAVPLAAIVIVREPADVPRLDAVRAADAVRDLLALTFRVPTPFALTETFDRLVAMAARTTVFDLHRPMTLESLDEVVSLVAERVTRQVEG
jgi:hypothetical protein